MTSVFLAFLLVSASCTSTPQVSQPSAKKLTDPLILNVALYPYVPNPAYFQQVVTNAWSQVPGAPSLNFVSWDCYSTDPSPSLDVFVFDAIFLSYFATSNYLRPYQPGEISNSGDYLPYALAGCNYNQQYYALPQIGCTDILFYRPGDSGMAAVTGLTSLWGVLGYATYTTAQPPPGVGFMMDFSGGTTAACEYLNTAECYYNSYTTNPALPAAGSLDPAVMGNLWYMVNMAGQAQAAYSNDNAPYQRATWFDGGSARATVGFTESMSAMPTLQNIVQFMTMPHADGTSFSLFYLDAVGVNQADVGTQKEGWAVQLANLLTSTSVISQAFAGGTSPQYLMPVRQSVFQNLGAMYPQYAQMGNLVAQANPQVFLIGPYSRTWLNANKSAIRQQILGLAGTAMSHQTAHSPGKAP